MKPVFFIAAFNALFFAGLLLRKRPKKRHDTILFFWLLYLAAATALYGFTRDIFAEIPLLASGIIALFLLHGPFMYRYVRSLSSGRKSTEAKELLHFFPFATFIIYLLIASRFPEYAQGISIDHAADAPEPPLLFVFFLIATALSGPVYYILAYNQYAEMKKSSAEFSAGEVNPDWLGKLISIFGVVWTLLIIIAVIHHIFNLFTMSFCTDGLFLSLSGFIILIGYFGLTQQEVFVSFVPPAQEVTAPKKYETSPLKEEELQKCFRRVSIFMASKKPYLNPDLTLPKLAEEVNVPVHHLSQVINEVHQNNFFDFVNRYRVEEVKRKIKDKKYSNYSLLAIAMESGFNSKSAFNRVFKNISGKTPSQFRDQNS